MKRVVLLGFVMVMASSAVFARGGVDAGEYRGSGRRLSTDGERVNLTGTILESEGFYVLETGDRRISLSAPGFFRSAVEVPVGREVSVTGTLVDCIDDCVIEADAHLFVETAVVGEEEYSFAAGGRAAGPGWGDELSPGFTNRGSGMGRTSSAPSGYPARGGRFSGGRGGRGGGMSGAGRASIPDTVRPGGRWYPAE